MSAAAPVRGRKPARKSRFGYAQVPQWLYLGGAKHVGETAWLIYGWILDTAAMRKREWVEATVEELAGPANVTDRAIEQGFAELLSEDVGWLERRPGPPRKVHGKIVRGWEYRSTVPRQEPLPKGADSEYGVCGHCGERSVMERHYGYCPTAHAYWRKLGACVANSTHRVVGVIMAHTLGWNEERCVLTTDDIARDSGLAARTVQWAIADAYDKGLIGRQVYGPHQLFDDGPSNCVEYWVIPDRFGTLPRLPMRKITPTAFAARKPKAAPDPAEQDEEDDDEVDSGFAEQKASARSRFRSGLKAAGEETEDTPGANGPDATEQPIVTPAARACDYVTIPVTRCRKCNAIGPHGLISGEVRGDPQPLAGGARAPTGAGPPQKRAKNAEMEGLDGVHEELYAYLAQWRDVMAELPTRVALEAVAAELAGAPIGMLRAECEVPSTLEYLARAKSYMIFRTFARKAAFRWKAMEQRRISAEQFWRERELYEREKSLEIAEETAERAETERLVDAAVERERAERKAARVEYWRGEVARMSLDEARWWMDPGRIGVTEGMRPAIVERWPELKR
jgi:hypothetical protein